MSETTNHEHETVTPQDGVEGEVHETVVVETGDSVVTDDLSVSADSGDALANGSGGPADVDVDPVSSDGEDAGEVPQSAGAEDGAEADDEPDDDSDDDENPLETEAEVAADYLEELLDIADLDGDIDTFIEGDRAHVSIVSESQVLVGPDGSVLDALQELTRLAVMTETGNRSRLMLDVAGYRDTRRQQLLQVAGEAVERVQSAGERVSLEPMNPFERKIVHDAVAAAGLVSESEGEEPRRHVVVLPAS
jgi:spoIIIJ-associated protein